ncbi:hypothetical protein ACFV16_34710 [Streptomyces massasporeus]|uniref:hypothetical protein n=1 Tax=Streptomyces massasporeus TaxID=67324 RepID=UPI0036A329F7
MLGLVQFLADGPFLQILADAGCQGMGAQTGGRVVTPAHRKFRKNPRAWCEERCELQRKARSSRRIRVEHGIAHLKNWRALARPLGRREHMSDIAPSRGRAAHTPADRHSLPRLSSMTAVRTADLDMPRPTVHEVVTGVAEVGVCLVRAVA